VGIIVAAMMGIGIGLMIAQKPWTIDSPTTDPANIQVHIQAGLWRAGFAILFLLAGLALTSRWWTAPLRDERPTACPGLSGLNAQLSTPKWFWPLVAAAMVVFAILAAFRLPQSLWDDEEYSVRKIVLGAYRMKDDGSLTIKQLPWKATLWHYEIPNNHGLQSVLARLSLSAYRAAARPPGLQINEIALRLPSYVMAVLSIGALALLVSRLSCPGAGVLAAWLLALHPWFLRLAPEARGYGLVFLFIPVVSLCALKAVDSGKWLWWAALAASEFALLYTWPGSLFTVAVLNLGIPVMIACCPSGRSVAGVMISRWLSSGTLALILLMPLTFPWIPQLSYWMENSIKLPLDTGWLKNVGSLFLTGSLWTKSGRLDTPYLEYLPSATVHPLPFLVVAVAAVSLITAGAIRLSRSGPQGAWMAAVFLAPGFLLYGLTKFRGGYIHEWYLAFMLPGFAGLAAIGIFAGLNGMTPPRWFRAIVPALAVAVVLAFAVFTMPARMRLVERSVEPYRESVLLTRPTLNPNASENHEVITATSLMAPVVYDPLIRRIFTVEDYKKLMREADARAVPFFVNNGYSSGVKDRFPDIFAMLSDTRYFDWVADLHGTEPIFDRTVYRYRPGSLSSP